MRPPGLPRWADPSGIELEYPGALACSSRRLLRHRMIARKVEVGYGRDQKSDMNHGRHGARPDVGSALAR